MLSGTYNRVMPRKRAEPTDGEDTPSWTFLTNHGHVLVCIANNPQVLVSEIADAVGIRERAAHRIVGDLVDAGYVVRRKEGRRNTYSVNLDLPMRHAQEADHSVGEFLRVLAGRRRRA